MTNFLKKETLIGSLGFGIGGILWGKQCFDWVITHSESFSNPFSFVLGAGYLAILSALSLSYVFLKSQKAKVFLFILLSVLVWVFSFLVVGIFVDFLWSLSLFTLQPFVAGFILLTKIENAPVVLDLKPSLRVATLWIEFLLTFFLVSIFYSLFLKKSLRKKVILYPPIVGSVASVFAPVVGNIVGFYLLHSLFLAYVLTFFLVSFSFGLMLVKELKNEREKGQ